MHDGTVLKRREWKLRPVRDFGCIGTDPVHPYPNAAALAARGASIRDARLMVLGRQGMLSDPEAALHRSGRAAEMIRESAGRKVGIIGDYDTDGILSTCMIRDMCLRSGADVRAMIPNRRRHGYGLNPRTVAAFKEAWGSVRPWLVITVDCGSSSYGHIKELKDWGVEKVVVIDHHIVDPASASSNADVHANWRLGGKEACAAGQCWQVARQLLGGKGAEDYMCMAAVATVADMVPVVGDSRILVRDGLDMAGKCPLPGFRQFVQEACSGHVSQRDVAFRLAPRINSYGRMGDPSEIARMMVSDDADEISRVLGKMESYNQQRKLVQKDMERVARMMVEQTDPRLRENGLLLYCDAWEPSVCGIACNDLVEEYGLPTLMFGQEDGRIKGSGRSLPGAPVKAIMDLCKHLFVRYGGHDMACGAELDPDAAELAADHFNEACGNYYAAHGRPDTSRVFDCDKVPDREFGHLLMETLYPYSAVENPEPVFRMPSAVVKEVVSTPYPTCVMTRFRCGADWFKTYDERLAGLRQGDCVNVYYMYPQSPRPDPEMAEWAVCSHKQVEDLEVVDVERTSALFA